MPFEKGKSGNPKMQFTSENQPKNRGRKGKSTTEYLRELGESKFIEFQVTITKNDGNPETTSIRVESQSEINQLLASRLIADAIKGDHKAIKEILDRTEGRAKQSIEAEIIGNIEISFED